MDNSFFQSFARKLNFPIERSPQVGCHILPQNFTWLCPFRFFSWTKRFRNLSHSYIVRPQLVAIRTATESALRHCTCSFMKISDSPKEKKRFKSVSVFLEKAWWHLSLQEKHLLDQNNKRTSELHGKSNQQDADCEIDRSRPSCFLILIYLG